MKVSRPTLIAVLAFLFGALVATLGIAQYSGFDVLSKHYDKTYLLKEPIHIQDASNNNSFEIPKDAVIRLNSSYQNDAKATLEFIISLSDLEKRSTPIEKTIVNRYWSVESTNEKQ